MYDLHKGVTLALWLWRLAPDRAVQAQEDFLSYVCKLPIADHVMLSREFFLCVSENYLFINEDMFKFERNNS